MGRYTPYTWADDAAGGTPITAARLNALEAGAAADVPVGDIDATGTPSGTTFLRGDGAWATPAGGGSTPDASTTVKGVVELATDTEATTGTDTVRAMTPANTAAVIAALLAGAPLAEIIRDVMGGALVAGSGVTVTVNDGADMITIAATGGGSTPDATTSVKGVVQLAGDLGGTAASPTVPGLAGKANTSHAHVAADVSDFATTVRATAASDTQAGSVELATAAEAVTGTDTARAVTPAGLTATRGLYVGVNAQTGTTYAPVLADQGKLVTLTNAAAITVTMPSNGTTAFPIGTQVDFVGLGAGLVTFAAGSGATVNGTPTLVTRAQYSAVTLIKISTNGWLAVGDLA